MHGDFLRKLAPRNGSPKKTQRTYNPKKVFFEKNKKCKEKNKSLKDQKDHFRKENQFEKSEGKNNEALYD